MKLMRAGLLVAAVIAVSLLGIPSLSRAFMPPAVQKPAAVLPPPGVKHMPEVEDLVFELTNRVRRAKGLPPLVKDEDLTQVARAYSDDMLVRRFFDHTTPDGVSFDERISGRYPYRVRTLGENIWTALGYNPANRHRVAQEIVDDWMSSPGHRANILDPDFTHLGVGVSARQRTVLATQEFVGRFKAFSFRDLITQAQ
ncbi:MAG: CAP domain-containing protein [Syntrophobacterales bacterium]|nr:CAP domain-containing protein [Syntrophobacterales bacterium]